MDLVTLSLPLFFLLIAVEAVAARLLRRELYRLPDALTNLSCGTLQQLLELFTAALLLAPYLALHARWRLFDWSMDSAVAWVVCFVLVDLGYYLFHRFSHQCAIAWGVHIVHHQSEEYNLTVALRQDALQPLVSTFFYLPLALLGFPPAMTLTCRTLNTLYQFWIHTRAIGRLGPLEWILNTPSHHRVHHGSERKYWDKNFAGVFITWDQLFGTFQREEEEPIYGVTEAPRSWNPLYVHVHYYTVLWDKFRRTKGPWNRLQVLLRKPGWLPPGMAAPAHVPHERYDARAAPLLVAYGVAVFLSALGGAILLLVRQGELSDVTKLLAAAFLAWTLTNVGVIVEGRRWALPSELLRLGVLLGLPLVLTSVAWSWTAPVALLLGAWLVFAFSRAPAVAPARA